jgi:hypothetical protein
MNRHFRRTRRAEVFWKASGREAGRDGFGGAMGIATDLHVADG